MTVISTGPPGGHPMVFDVHCQLYRADNPAMKSAFGAVTQGRAMTAEWREDEADVSGVADPVLQYARAADLVVAAQTDPQWPGSERLDVADRLAIESGRPVLITPNAGMHDQIAEKVLVAWNGRPSPESMDRFTPDVLAKKGQPEQSPIQYPTRTT